MNRGWTKDFHDFKDSIKDGNIEKVREIMQYPGFQVDNCDRDFWNRTPLLLAIDWAMKCKQKQTCWGEFPIDNLDARLDIIKIFLEAGAKDENSLTIHYGHPCLYAVVEADLVEILALMVQQYNFNLKNAEVSQHLTILTNVRSAEMCQLLINLGINPSVCDTDVGYTPLFKCNLAIGKVLLGHGVDINAKSKNGTTAILQQFLWVSTELAICSGDREIEEHVLYANYLLDQGANITITRDDGHSVIKIASNYYHSEKNEDVKALYKRVLDQAGIDLNSIHEPSYSVLLYTTDSYVKTTRCGAPDVNQVLLSGIPCCHDVVGEIMTSLNLNLCEEEKNSIVDRVALRCMCIEMTDDEIQSAILSHII